MNKLVLILSLLVNVLYVSAQETPDSTDIIVKGSDSGILNRYSFKHVDHDKRIPSTKEVPYWAVLSAPDIHIQLQNVFNKSLSPEKLEELKGKKIGFSFNVNGSGKIKSVEIQVLTRYNIEFSKKECQQLLVNVKKDVTFETDKDFKDINNLYISISHKIE